jgi:DNA-directed RNA polymerase specialized sigma24 family protein
VERVRARLDAELDRGARHYSYREIQQLLDVTYTWVNRHVTEGRRALREAEAAAEAEAAVREAA